MLPTYLGEHHSMAYTMDGDRVCLLTHVWVPLKHRGEGLGSKMLARVLADADTEGKTVMLKIDPGPGGLRWIELAAWYQRHGFVWLSRETGEMVRKPQQREEADGASTD